MSDAMLNLSLRNQILERDSSGYLQWRTLDRPTTVRARQTALVICDVWDCHTYRGAAERVEKMVDRMNLVAHAARDRGVLIVHAPGEVMDFYKDHPARYRALAAPRVEPPPTKAHPNPPLPVNKDEESDTDNDPGMLGPEQYPWTRQHPRLDIDATRDVISENGQEHLNVYRQRGIRHVLFMGTHANCCLLNRSFAIKQMVCWDFNVALLRDLTDTLYSPNCPPYVSHAEGTRLVVEFIEKVWCPTIDSQQLLEQTPR